MSTQEAIEMLKYIFYNCNQELCKYVGRCDGKCSEALFMAIRALNEQEDDGK